MRETNRTGRAAVLAEAQNTADLFASLLFWLGREAFGWALHAVGTRSAPHFFISECLWKGAKPGPLILGVEAGIAAAWSFKYDGLPSVNSRSSSYSNHQGCSWFTSWWPDNRSFLRWDQSLIVLNHVLPHLPHIFAHYCLVLGVAPEMSPLRSAKEIYCHCNKSIGKNDSWQINIGQSSAGKKAPNPLIFYWKVKKYNTADFLLRVHAKCHQSAHGKHSRHCWAACDLACLTSNRSLQSKVCSYLPCMGWPFRVKLGV